MEQDARNVFVVHGRNLDARNSLFRFLRSIGLRPLEWSQAIQMTGKASPFIGEILDVAFSKAQAIVVLMTPDDVAQLQDPYRSSSDPPHEEVLTGQARPNVLFEAGMAMGRSPDRTVIVELGTLRPFSDIAGRHTVKLSNNSSARHELAQRLSTAGCAVDLSGKDWHTEGSFDLKPVTPAETSPARGDDGQQAIQKGTTVKDETVRAQSLSQARHLHSAVDPEWEREMWFKSAQGVLDAEKELDTLFSALELRVKRVGELNEHLDLSFTRITKVSCVATSIFSRLVMRWDYDPYRIPDSLENSKLSVYVPTKMPATRWVTNFLFGRRLRLIRIDLSYDIQLTKHGLVGWLEDGGTGELFTTDELADKCLSLILKPADN